MSPLNSPKLVNSLTIIFLTLAMTSAIYPTCMSFETSRISFECFFAISFIRSLLVLCYKTLAVKKRRTWCQVIFYKFCHGSPSGTGNFNDMLPMFIFPPCLWLSWSLLAIWSARILLTVFRFVLWMVWNIWADCSTNRSHFRRKRGGGGKGGMCPPLFWLGGNGMFVPPTFNPTFLFSTWIIRLYNTDKQLFGIFHIPINYLVDNFNKLTQMAVIK